MKRAFLNLPLILVALLFFGLKILEAKEDNKKVGPLHKVAIKGDNTVFDVNNIKTYIRNNGSFNRDPGTGNAGLEWPKGSGNTAIYASGLWIGAKTHDTVRVAIAEYSYEYIAGSIASGVNPQDSRWKVYKIKRGDDATNNPDYLNWPFADGAPAVRNFSNTADSLDASGNKIPQLLGDMTVWCVFNDNDPGIHNNEKTPPLGVEVQLTAWGYSRADALGNTVFYRWKLINKGGRQLDSMFVCIWSDCDIGGGSNDYDGCDTLLSLGYTFSGIANNSQYGSTPPAAGFDFLQGPIVPSVGDTTRLPDGTVKPGYKKMNMTSYIFYNNDVSDWGNPGTGQEVYNYFQGKSRTGKDTVDPAGNISRFMFSGDPNVANGPTNWVEDGQSGDRRFMMSSGPFTMFQGDTQVVVGGNLIAQGSSNTASVTALKNADALVQKAYDLNFGLAAPPPAPKVEVSELNNGVVLTWGKDEAAADNIESFTFLDPIASAGGAIDPVYKFEGYVVYQFANTSGVNPKVLYTLDLKNGIKDIYDDVFDPNIGKYVNRPVKFGTDIGVSRTVRITKDAYTGHVLANDKDYYFGVTAYTYNKESIPKTLESSMNVITLRTHQVRMGGTFSSTGADTIGTYSPSVKRTILPHSAGSGVGHAEAIIIQPDSITGDTYEIRFDAIGSGTAWKIVNTTKNIVVDNLKTNQSDDERFPIKDGIKFKVVDAPSRLDVSTPGGGVDVTPADTTLQWIDGDGGDWGMPYFNGGLDLGANISSYLGFSASTLPTTYNPYKKVQLILGGPTQKVYRYRRTAVGGVTRYRLQDLQTLPLQAWDISDPLHPKQLNLAWRDQVNDNVWDPSTSYLEVLLICSSGYDSTGAAYGNGGPWETDAMYILGTLVKPNHTLNESQNTITITPLRANGPSDIYVINTSNYKSTKGDVATAKTQIARINAVPNPYFAANAYEHNQFGRVVRFTNLPAVAKIRIFNLAGELVKVLDKNDPQATEFDWDLTNNNSLPVASGMYIVYIDMGAIGTKILKVAVIMAEERLDNF